MSSQRPDAIEQKQAPLTITHDSRVRRDATNAICTRGERARVRVCVAGAYPRAVALRVGGVRADDRLVEARVEAALAVAHAFVQQRTPTVHLHHCSNRIIRGYLKSSCSSKSYLSVACRKRSSEQRAECQQMCASIRCLDASYDSSMQYKSPLWR